MLFPLRAHNSQNSELASAAADSELSFDRQLLQQPSEVKAAFPVEKQRADQTIIFSGHQKRDLMFSRPLPQNMP